MLDEFTMLLILAYFKELKEDYSLSELKELLGVSLETLDENIEELLNNGILHINEKSLISLTHKGRIVLMNSKMENYSFKSDIYDSELLKETWPISKPYSVHKFKRFKWRGSEK